MDGAKTKKVSDKRASQGVYSDFSQNDQSDEIDDPISAYFKQRCGNSGKTYFRKHLESDSDSSIGLIDVDNVSLFDDVEEQENQNLRFSEHINDSLNRDSVNLKKKNRKSKVESELDKQRALAQKALERLSCKSNENQNENSVLTPEKKESKVLMDISSKIMNLRLSYAKNLEEWFQPNFSPNTPRFFNDELSSFGTEDGNLPLKNKDNADEELSKSRRSQYAKNVNSMIKELACVPATADMEFESQTKEKQIKKFEEDEKKFKLENSGVLHNSQISQFSGIAGEDFSQWSAEANNPTLDTGKKNLSIGQFFNMRSNRISSLVGSVANDDQLPCLEQITETSTLPEVQTQHHSKSECSFPIGEISLPEKPKIRRCVSTFDLKRGPEIPKGGRYSSDSCSSNSTLMIQDILAEMESGLSGTQMYEKLMKSYGRRKNEVKQLKKTEEKKEKLAKVDENGETPKSSKVSKRRDMVKSNKKELTVNEPRKESRSLGGQSSVFSPGKERKEDKTNYELKLNETMPLARNEKIKKGGNNNGFYASTPKTYLIKSPNDKFKTTCGKVLMNDDDWEAPRVNSIRPFDLNKSTGSEENDKTVTVNSTTTSSELSKKNNTTIVINDTVTIEDTIVAGDLTVLSQRIEEMKRDSVCIVRSVEPNEPVLLTVIQKLADLPKGSLDCSALTPLIRDQFPELLSNFPTPSEDSSDNILLKADVKVKDALVALPGSWIRLPGVWGLKQKIYACADLERTILIPVVNISQSWLLISLEALELVHPQGKKLPGVKKNNELCVSDFVVVSLKETIIPPDNRQTLKIFFKSKVATKLELMLTFSVKELMNGEVQNRNLRLLINNVHPENYINVLPKDPINFGVIADQCFDQTTVQVSFEGICELPLTVYIDQDDSISGYFILRPCNGPKQEKEWDDKIYHHLFYEGDKQVLEFRIVFRPNILLKEDSKTQNFKASLVLMLGSKTDTDGILRKIPIKGSVGFAKFLCNSSCTPLVFRVTERGHSITRSYPLKNVGSLPIAFSVSIVNEDRKVMEGEDVFVAPMSFYLSKNEEAGINVTFNANSNHNFTKRCLRLQIKPNGRVIYEIELIGIITSIESRPVSRTSGTSVSTKSGTNSGSVPVKLLTTTLSLSWPAISLEKEARQTFQIKNLSNITVSVRVTFERNLDAFKLVNENGEKVHKVRKVLKPDCPCALTVVFRPDVVGAHNTSLMFETSHSSLKKKILLNGIGGMPNLLMRNIKFDLNGCKILRLQHSRNSNQFENTIMFTNEGRIPAFLLIKPGVKDYSLSHEMSVSPSSVVIYPDTTVAVKLSQKLKNSDLQQLLSDREIRKIATVCVVTGDEPSRLRIRKLVNSEKLQANERLSMFTAHFQDEKEMHLKNFKDPAGFENEFLKSLKVHEVAIVIEKNAELYEPSILEETADEFVSFVSDNTTISMPKSQRRTETEGQSEPLKSTLGKPAEINTTLFSADLLKSTPSHTRVTKWLETLDCS